MKITPRDAYYVWDCDWCDSHNRTPWTRIDEGKVVCGVCYSKFSLFPSTAGDNAACLSVALG